MKLRHLFLNSIFGVMTLSTSAAMLGADLIPIYAAPASSVQTSSGTVSGTALGSGSASIKVKPVDGQSLTNRKFVLYQLLTATQSGDTFLYAIPSEMKEHLKSALSTAGKASLDNDAQMIAALESFRAQESGAEKLTNADFRKFVDAISEKLKDVNAGLQIEVQDVGLDNAFTITNLPVGYYLLDEITEDGAIPEKSTASLCMLETIADSTEITIKSLTTMISMTGEDEDGTPAGGEPGAGGDSQKVVDLQIGEKVKLKASITLPPKGFFAKYPVEVQNTLPAELDFDPQTGEITVKIDETPLSKDTDFTIDGIADNDFTIKMENLAEKLPEESKTLTIEYEATLKKEAASSLENRDGFKAEMELTYPNDPNEESSTAKQKDEVTIFTYALDGVKTDLTAENYLEGAQFKLYKDATAEQEIKLADFGSGTYVPDTSGSAAMISQATTGAFKLAGIDAGTYYLKEEKAPDGYYAIDGTIKLEVKPTYDGTGISTLSGTATYVDPSTNQSSQTSLKAVESKPAINMQIKNKKGGLLPSTGSSLMLIGLAGLAGLLATSLFLSREKKGKENKKSKGNQDKERSLDIQTRDFRKNKSLSFDCTIEPLDCTREEMLKLLQEKAREVYQEKERKEKTDKIKADAQALEQDKEVQEAVDETVDMEGDDQPTEEEETDDEQAEPQAQEAEDAAVNFDLEKSCKEH